MRGVRVQGAVGVYCATAAAPRPCAPLNNTAEPACRPSPRRENVWQVGARTACSGGGGNSVALDASCSPWPLSLHRVPGMAGPAARHQPNVSPPLPPPPQGAVPVLVHLHRRVSFISSGPKRRGAQQRPGRERRRRRRQQAGQLRCVQPLSSGGGMASHGFRRHPSIYPSRLLAPPAPLPLSDILWPPRAQCSTPDAQDTAPRHSHVTLSHHPPPPKGAAQAASQQAVSSPSIFADLACPRKRPFIPSTHAAPLVTLASGRDYTVRPTASTMPGRAQPSYRCKAFPQQVQCSAGNQLVQAVFDRAKGHLGGPAVRSLAPPLVRRPSAAAAHLHPQSRCFTCSPHHLRLRTFQ